MNPKLICLFVVIAAVCADVKVPVPLPERFPPGVDPVLCPDYPNCDNALLHGTERIAAVPTYYRSVVPSVRYVNSLQYYAPYNSLYYPSVASVRAIAPVAPIVSTVHGPSHISHVAPLSTDTPLDPNRPVVPFASSPGLTSRYYVI